MSVLIVSVGGPVNPIIVPDDLLAVVLSDGVETGQKVARIDLQGPLILAQSFPILKGPNFMPNLKYSDHNYSLL